MWAWIDAHPVLAQVDMVFLCLVLMVISGSGTRKPPRGGNPNAH
jgi:hypothetical protein